MGGAIRSVGLLGAADNLTFGGELLRAIVDRSASVRSHAASVLTCMVDGNAPAKQRLLGASLQPTGQQAGASSKLLMPHCLECISGAVNVSGELPTRSTTRGSSTSAAVSESAIVCALYACIWLPTTSTSLTCSIKLQRDISSLLRCISAVLESEVRLCGR